MKKILMIFICAIMVFEITGCNSSSSNTDTNKSKNKNELDTFETDDWATIASNVKSGKVYKIGSTKKIDMGKFGTKTVRVANNSTPDECKKDGYSQTACGFVVEFEDVISKYNMGNPKYDNDDSIGSGNIGGWENSEMRKYLSTDIYNSLPDDLKSVIIDTKVVSGYGHNMYDKSNFITTDKLYLLTCVEIWGSMPEYGDTVTEDLTRQLDYYHEKKVTTSNYESVPKGYNKWWLRSPYEGNQVDYMLVDVYGKPEIHSSNFNLGISPAFRIG